VPIYKEKCYAIVVNIQENNMARTKREIPYKHYWGYTKDECKRDWEKSLDEPKHAYSGRYDRYRERAYLLHGTDTMNHCYPTHEYFNRIHRVGRALERDQLRPHIVLGDDFDFDDSHYIAKYKGVWWEIY
jgi:hypothetical protein